jgi:hypothetical protein
MPGTIYAKIDRAKVFPIILASAQTWHDLSQARSTPETADNRKTEIYLSRRKLGIELE